MIVGASCGSRSVLLPVPCDMARFPALADDGPPVSAPTQRPHSVRRRALWIAHACRCLNLRTQPGSTARAMDDADEAEFDIPVFEVAARVPRGMGPESAQEFLWPDRTKRRMLLRALWVTAPCVLPGRRMMRMSWLIAAG